MAGQDQGIVPRFSSVVNGEVSLKKRLRGEKQVVPLAMFFEGIDMKNEIKDLMGQIFSSSFHRFSVFLWWCAVF